MGKNEARLATEISDLVGEFGVEWFGLECVEESRGTSLASS